jgi:hypothetical protein
MAIQRSAQAAHYLAEISAEPASFDVLARLVEHGERATARALHVDPEVET